MLFPPPPRVPVGVGHLKMSNLAQRAGQDALRIFGWDCLATKSRFQEVEGGGRSLCLYRYIYIYIYICRESKRERERDSVPLGVPKVDSTVVRVRILRVRIPRPSVWVAWAASPTSWWFANRTRHPDGKNGKKPSLWVTQLDGRYYVLLGDDGGYDNILLYYGSKGGGPTRTTCTGVAGWIYVAIW